VRQLAGPARRGLLRNAQRAALGVATVARVPSPGVAVGIAEANRGGGSGHHLPGARRLALGARRLAPGGGLEGRVGVR